MTGHPMLGFHDWAEAPRSYGFHSGRQDFWIGAVAAESLTRDLEKQESDNINSTAMSSAPTGQQDRASFAV